MAGLTGFLLARIAEDEELAREAGGHSWPVSAENHLALPMVLIPNLNGSRFVPPGSTMQTAGSTDAQTFHIARHDPARVLAECEAKRRIVEDHNEEVCDRPRGGTEPGCSICSETNYVDGGRYSSGWPCDTLRALLSIYADHPDYLEEWRA